MSDKNSLPVNWAWSTLGEVALYLNGKAFKSSDWENIGRPIIRIQNLTGSGNTINYYSKPVEERYVIYDGDLLISWSATLGAYIYRGEEAVLNQHIFKVIPYINKKFLYYLTNNSINELMKRIHGSGMQHVTKARFESFTIPLPPLPEQHRIVAKIEELFTKLDAGVAALQKAKALLKQYRQSVLKAAVEGRLTEEWRKEHASEIEPASVLLERIQEERKKRLGKKYKPPKPVDTSNLPELPNGWVWAPLLNVAMLHRGYDLPVQKRIKGPYPIIASSSIVGYHKEKMIEGPGVITGRSGTIGKVIYIDSDYWPLNTTLYVCDFNCNTPRFIYYLLKSMKLQRYLAGTGVPTLNRNIVHPTPVPLPPVSEQVVISNILDNYFSIIDESEQIINAELKRSRSLRQSILKRAFEGKLVPQDPNDLPAPRPDRYYVYVLECSNGSHYIGQTHDIEKRWIEHIRGKGADWTRKYPPVKLVHWEEFETREAAVKREKDLKTGFGRKWLKREIEAGRTRQAGESASVLLERIKSIRQN